VLSRLRFCLQGSFIQFLLQTRQRRASKYRTINPRSIIVLSHKVVEKRLNKPPQFWHFETDRLDNPRAIVNSKKKNHSKKHNTPKKTEY